MTDSIRKAARHRAHARHVETCVCGVRVSGNGRKSHFRACEKHLREIGWPLDDATAEGIRAEHPSTRVFGKTPLVVSVQQRLGRFYADRLGVPRNRRTKLSAADHRALVWQFVDEELTEREAQRRAS